MFGPSTGWTGASPAALAAPVFIRAEARILERLAELTAMYGSYGAAWIMFGEGAT